MNSAFCFEASILFTEVGNTLCLNCLSDSHITNTFLVALKGAGSIHTHHKTMKYLGATAVLGIRERPTLTHNLVTHRYFDKKTCHDHAAKARF